MRCPFLREALVRSCQTATFRKMLVQTPGAAAGEKCSSDRYQDCSIYQAHEPRIPPSSHCPFLQESLMQYCGASPVVKFVPYSESELSRCGNDDHRYCDLFRAIINAGKTETARPATRSTEARECGAEEVGLPRNLWYTANHLWLDNGDNGNCHVGIDAFLARVLGRVEHVSFLTSRGSARPAVVLTAHGIDLQLVFPNPFVITGINVYLRAAPSRLTDDPYSAGWLFQGTEIREAGERPTHAVRRGLVPGTEASRWMQSEVQRIDEFVRGVAGTATAGHALVADGGRFVSGLAGEMGREDVLRLFNEFFAPFPQSRGIA